MQDKSQTERERDTVTAKRAKDFLKQIEKIDKLIENKRCESEALENKALNTTSQLTPDKVQSSGEQQKMALAVEECVFLDGEIKRLKKTRSNIIRTIEKLETTEYDILHKVYVQKKSLQDVADAYKRSYQWAYKQHKKAINHLQEYIDKNVKRLSELFGFD